MRPKITMVTVVRSDVWSKVVVMLHLSNTQRFPKILAVNEENFGQEIRWPMNLNYFVRMVHELPLANIESVIWARLRQTLSLPEAAGDTMKRKSILTLICLRMHSSTTAARNTTNLGAYFQFSRVEICIN